MGRPRSRWAQRSDATPRVHSCGRGELMHILGIDDVHDDVHSHALVEEGSDLLHGSLMHVAEVYREVSLDVIRMHTPPTTPSSGVCRVLFDVVADACAQILEADGVVVAYCGRRPTPSPQLAALFDRLAGGHVGGARSDPGSVCGRVFAAFSCSASTTSVRVGQDLVGNASSLGFVVPPHPWLASIAEDSFAQRGRIDDEDVVALRALEACASVHRMARMLQDTGGWLRAGGDRPPSSRRRPPRARLLEPARHRFSSPAGDGSG